MIPTTPTRLLLTGLFARPLLRGCSRKKCDLMGGMCSNGHGIGLIGTRWKKWTKMKSGSKRRMQRLLCGTLNRKEEWGSSKFAIRCHQREQHWLNDGGPPHARSSGLDSIGGAAG